MWGGAIAALGGGGGGECGDCGDGEFDGESVVVVARVRWRCLNTIWALSGADFWKRWRERRRRSVACGSGRWSTFGAGELEPGLRFLYPLEKSKYEAEGRMR